MKLARYLIICMVAAALLTGCKDKKTSAAPLSKPDTCRVLAMVMDTITTEIKHDVVYRIIQSVVKVDSATKELSWLTDSLYYRPVMDTVRNPLTKLPVLDSAGKSRQELTWQYTPKKFVVDSKIIVDSVISRFKQYMPDSLTKNPR